MMKESEQQKKQREERDAKFLQMMNEAKAAFPDWELKRSQWGHMFSIGPIEIEPRQAQYGGPATLGERAKVELMRQTWATGLKNRVVVCKWASFITGADSWKASYAELVAKQALNAATAKVTASLAKQAEESLMAEKLNDPKVLQVEVGLRRGSARLVLMLGGVLHLPKEITFEVLPEVRDLYEADAAVRDFQRHVKKYEEAISAIRARINAREHAAELAVLQAAGKVCNCGHTWSQHKAQDNGSQACTHNGCGCRDVVLP